MVIKQWLVPQNTILLIHTRSQVFHVVLRHLKTDDREAVPLVFADKVEESLLLVKGAWRLQLVQRAQVEQDALVEVTLGVAVNQRLQGRQGLPETTQVQAAHWHVVHRLQGERGSFYWWTEDKEEFKFLTIFFINFSWYFMPFKCGLALDQDESFRAYKSHNI